MYTNVYETHIQWICMKECASGWLTQIVQVVLIEPNKKKKRKKEKEKEPSKKTWNEIQQE